MQEKIRQELTLAMKARDVLKTNVIRGLLTGFTNELVAKGKKPQDSLTDEEAISVIRRALKQRKDSIEQFKKGGRDDLALNEEAELKIIETYLPAQLSKEEIYLKATGLKEEMGINDKAKVGVFMGALMKSLKGQADGSLVKEVAEELFK